MKKNSFKTLAWLAALLSLAACQAFPGSPVLSTPLPLTGDHASPLGASALVIRDQTGMAGSALVPILAETGQPTAGYAPIDVGRDAQYGLSPDREQLAYVSVGAPDCAHECLYLLNLRTWKQVFKPVALNQDESTWVSSLAFNPAGTRLALAFNSQDQSTSRLMLVDLSRGALIQQVPLPMNIYNLGIAPDGSIVLEGTGGVRPDKMLAARVMLLDGSSLAVTWQKDLEDAPFGTEATFNPQDPSQGEYLYPAAAFSPDKTRLYIAAADTPKLITVDFANRSAQTVLIQKQMGWLERLLTAGASVAYGKALNGAIKSGVLSADGKIFYIVGQTSKAVQDKDGNWNSETTMLGLQVVDVASGTQTGDLQSDATQVNLSVDGKTLLLNGWTDSNGISQDWTDAVDASTLKKSGHFLSQVRSSRLLDGSLVYLGSHFRDDNGTDMILYRPSSPVPLSSWSEPINNYADWVIIP